MGKEKWEEYYTETELLGVQHIEFDLLRVFVDTCNLLNLDYVAYGGTLLGIVKYGDIIPWDDDIDVAMPRECYEAFLQKAESVLPTGYYIQSPYNTPNSPYPYTKFRKSGTKYIEYINRNIPIDTGVYIDIYPIDSIPNDYKMRKQQFKIVRKWIMLYVCRQGRLYDKYETSLNGKLRNILKWILNRVLRLLPQQYYVHKIDHYMTMYNQSNCKRFAALNSPNFENTYDSIFPLLKMKFGELEINVPNDYLGHLKRRYGDYQKELPADKRYGHIPYILDLGDVNRNENDLK